MAQDKDAMDGFGEKWKNFVEHVNTHPADKVVAAVNIVVNKESVNENGDMSVHICNLFGGSPENLARAFVEGIGICVDKIPGFKNCLSQALLMKAIEASIKKAVATPAVAGEEAPVDPAAVTKSEAAMKELLEKFQLPPSGGIH